jgi:hypothetical protein
VTPTEQAKVSAAASARMKALHADPEFKAKTAARMKALHADPEYHARFANALPQLSKEQRKVYVKLRALVGRDAALKEALR